MRPVSIAAGETFSVCRMGRSDVVARMLIELLDEDCMKAVIEALAGLRTEEAIQAVVQVSLTLASADRPDVIADVSTPSLPVPSFLSVLSNLTQLTNTGEFDITLKLYGCSTGAWPCKGVNIYSRGCTALHRKKSSAYRS